VYALKQGSGFVIDDKGHVLTNNHVVADADEVVVLIGTQKEPKQIKAKVVGTDKITDLALLKMVNPPSKLKPLTFGDSDKIRVGQTAIAMGNPFGLSGTVTRGIISSLHRSIGQGPYDDFLQTDASINFGNSGGPLFDIKGEVIGINTAINANGHGIGFAIPINMAKKLIPQLEKGRVIRAWLGIVGENNRPAFQMQFGISNAPGVVIYSVIARRPAMRAGLRSGDVVTAVDGVKVKDIYDLQREVQQKRPAETVDLSVSRATRAGTHDLHMKVKLEELPPSENFSLLTS
jgi:serine protease Do